MTNNTPGSTNNEVLLRGTRDERKVETIKKRLFVWSLGLRRREQWERLRYRRCWSPGELGIRVSLYLHTYRWICWSKYTHSHSSRHPQSTSRRNNQQISHTQLRMYPSDTLATWHRPVTHSETIQLHIHACGCQTTHVEPIFAGPQDTITYTVDTIKLPYRCKLCTAKLKRGGKKWWQCWKKEQRADLDSDAVNKPWVFRNSFGHL